jgi:hypothetical protein
MHNASTAQEIEVITPSATKDFEFRVRLNYGESVL